MYSAQRQVRIIEEIRHSRCSPANSQIPRRAPTNSVLWTDLYSGLARKGY